MSTRKNAQMGTAKPFTTAQIKTLYDLGQLKTHAADQPDAKSKLRIVWYGNNRFAIRRVVAFYDRFAATPKGLAIRVPMCPLLYAVPTERELRTHFFNGSSGLDHAGYDSLVSALNKL